MQNADKFALEVKKSEKNELDLPEVDCENAKVSDSQDNQKGGTNLRVNLFCLQNIEFNLHIVGTKKTEGDIIFDSLRCALVIL